MQARGHGFGRFYDLGDKAQDIDDPKGSPHR